MIADHLPLWIGFTLFIIGMLALDLGLFQRRPHVIGMREALVWFAVWTSLALLFNLGLILFHERGMEAGLEFFTGFLVEKSLSIDNVFVFILIFNYFHVPPAYQHKVLFWGIIGAIVLRVIFIVGGLALMERFHWTMYIFGAFLVGTGIAMMRKNETHVDPEKNWIIRSFRRLFPVTNRYEGNRFFVRKDNRVWATPLFIVLLAIESSDIVFAVDSIPAIFAITSDPFIIYTSNIFAMLGLRALYFAVSGFMRMFHFLHYGFASIILILGVKMLLSDVYHVPVQVTLVLIVNILLICVIVSLLRPRRVDLKPLLARTARLGHIPFRRLLLIENIIDLGARKVSDAMRGLGGVSAIRLDRPWEENLRMIRSTRFSRYPVIENGSPKPTGVIHVKNLFVLDAAGGGGLTSEQVRRATRPCPEMPADLPLEDALTRFQKRSDQLAVVVNPTGEWAGIITIEDVLEELVGGIGDEFDAERGGEPISLGDALSVERVVLDLQADSLDDAIQQLIGRIPPDALPGNRHEIVRALQHRDQIVSTYIGRGLVMPHARLEGLSRPLLAFARSGEGVPLENSSERAELIFLLLTPTGLARMEPRLLEELAGLFDSEYVTERLRQAGSAEEVVEAIRTGQQVVVE